MYMARITWIVKYEYVWREIGAMKGKGYAVRSHPTGNGITRVMETQSVDLAVMTRRGRRADQEKK